LSNSSFTSIGGLNAARSTNVGANGFTVANGVISIAKASGPVVWATPGGRLIFSGGVGGATGSTNDQECTITGISADATNTHISTSGFAGWENVNTLEIEAHPAPTATFVNCTGCNDAIDLSQSGAQGKPLYSYTKRTYTGNNSGTMIKLSGSAGPMLWGRIVSAKVTVSQAYTGAQPSLLANPFTPLRQLNPDGTASNWNPTFDLKTVGTRTITASSVVGAAGADSITIPGDIWFCEDQPVTVNHDVSGESSALWPIVTIEVQTDQGFPAAAMPGYKKFSQFVADLANGVHNLGSNALKIALSDVAPLATNSVFANITEIAAGNGYVAGGAVTSQTSSSQTAGVYSLLSGAISFTASGGSIGPFRYLVLYNSTPTSPLRPLIAWYDYGSEVTINAGTSFSATFDPVNGALQLA
jgi:hypothetical protein